MRLLILTITLLAFVACAADAAPKLIAKSPPIKAEVRKAPPVGAVDVFVMDRKTRKIKRAKLDVRGMVSGLPAGDMEKMQAAIMQRVQELAEQGLRTLVTAVFDAYRKASPDQQAAFLVDLANLIDKHFPNRD